jgi:hypothetical protein
MRLASSETTMVSGSCTSRTCFSAFWPKPIAFWRAFSCLRFIAARLRVRPPSPSSASGQRQLAGAAAVVNLGLGAAICRAVIALAVGLARGGRPGLAMPGHADHRRQQAATPGLGRVRLAATCGNHRCLFRQQVQGAGWRRDVPSTSALRAAARATASAAASTRTRSSSSTLARRAASRSRSSRSLVSISSRRRARSSSRSRSSTRTAGVVLGFARLGGREEPPDGAPFPHRKSRRVAWTDRPGVARW